jgi:hypothetical protein
MKIVPAFLLFLFIYLSQIGLAGEQIVLSPQEGHSNQNQINEAIKQAASSAKGASVFLTEGVYQVDNTIIMKSNVRLLGDSNAIIRVWGGSSQWFTGRIGVISCKESLKNVEIAGFQIDGNIGNLPSKFANSQPGREHDCEKLINIGGYSGDFANNIKIHDMKLYNAFSDGIYIIYAQNVEIYNNFISNCQHEGIYFSVVRGGGHIHNNRIAGITSDCARLDNCKNCLIEYNLFFSYSGNSYGAYKHGENGLQIGDAGSSKGYNAAKKGYPTEDIEVRFNTFSDPGLRAIWLHGGKNVYIHDNEFVDAAILETMGIPIGDISIDNQPTVEMTEKVFDSIFDIFSMDFTTQAGNNDTVILPEGVKEIPSEAIGTITQYEQGNLSYTLVSVPTVGLSEVRYEVNGKEAVHTLMLGEKQGSKIVFSNCSIWSGDFDRIGDSLYLEGVVEPEDIEVTCVSPVNEFKPILEVEQVETPNRFFHPILKFVFMVIFGAIGFIYLNLKFAF